uniref:diguanylate cyclase n=1 Tax=Acidobacterium capsulatum TaxID=33075 RepID=A0A7V5CUP6_9BACT
MGLPDLQVMQIPIPRNEAERLKSLQNLKILDTPSEAAYDDLTRLAAYVCDAPMASITLVDEDRQWFKSRIGLNQQETPRSISFCAHAIAQNELFVVPDATKDERFSGSPLVLEDPNIRFYAGMPIVSPEGFHVGTLCVLDKEPRELTEEKQVALRVLARQVATQFQMRRQLLELREARAKQTKIEQRLRESQTRLKELNARLQELVTTDGLTGVKNRRAFDEGLQQAWKMSARTKSPLSLLMVDVDHFKRVNDTLGHEAGDDVLRLVAQTLQFMTRSTDMVARYGGEEFVVVLPGTEAEPAVAFAEQLRLNIANLSWRGHPLTVSIGVDSGSGSGKAECELVAHADAALYRAKNSGRNRVLRFDPAQDDVTAGQHTA